MVRAPYMMVLVQIRLQQSCPSEFKAHGSTRFRLSYMCSFLYFYAYTLLRALVLRRASSSSSKPARAPTLSMAHELLFGYLAGVASKMIASPLSVVTVRLQIAREKDDEGLPGSTVKDVAATVQSVYEDEGWKGFWKGTIHLIYLLLYGLHKRHLARL